MADKEQPKYVATLRAIFTAEDDVHAQLIANELAEQAGVILDEGDTIDYTQVILAEITGPISPIEVVEKMRQMCDILISTRIKECYEMAQWLHKIAYMLEHRFEEFGDSPGPGYDYGEFTDRAKQIFDRMRKEQNANRKG